MRTTTAWVILLLAGGFEMIWAVGLKYTDGFTRLWPSVGTLIAMVVSVWLLSLAMRTLPWELLMQRGQALGRFRSPCLE